MKRTFISAHDAAILSGVSTQTIRNLCKNNTLTHQLRGNLFWVLKEDVLKYKDTISAIHEASADMERYLQEIEDKRDQYKQILAIEKEKQREQLLNIFMFPKRIEAIEELLTAVIESTARFTDYEYCNIDPRDIHIMMRHLKGDNFEQIGNQTHLTKDTVRQLWYRALRRLTRTKAYFYTINERYAEAKRALDDKNEEIARLHAQLQGKEIVIDDKTKSISRLLDTSVYEFDLSVRVLNCLEHAEIKTIRDLVNFHRADLLKYRQFGKKSLTELDELIEHYELQWGMDTTIYPTYQHKNL